MRGILTIVFFASITALSVVRIPTQEQAIVLEAESYADIKAPMVLSRNDPKASGNAYVSLPLGAGQGWRGKGGGRNKLPHRNPRRWRLPHLGAHPVEGWMHQRYVP